MGLAGGIEKKRLWAAVLLMGGMLETCGLFSGSMIFCEAKEDQVEQEVIDLATAFFEAQTPEELEAMEDHLDNPNSLEYQLYVVKQQTYFACGCIERKNIEVRVFPLSSGQRWCAVGSGDWVIRDCDAVLPEFEARVIKRNADGELQIKTLDAGDEEIALLEEILTTDEIVAELYEKEKNYAEALAANPELNEWKRETEEAYDQATEELARKRVEKYLASYSDYSYTVKEGDCLWSIAEEQLGNGRLWSSLYEQNQDVIGENPDLLYVGITLRYGAYDSSLLY